jgi:hypothetical protein
MATGATAAGRALQVTPRKHPYSFHIKILPAHETLPPRCRRAAQFVYSQPRVVQSALSASSTWNQYKCMPYMMSVTQYMFLTREASIIQLGYAFHGSASET